MSVIYCNKTIIIIIIIINARWNDYFNIYIILQRSSLKTSDTEKVTSSWELLEGFVAVQYNFLLIFTTNSAACQRTKRPEIAWARFFCWEFNCFCAAPRSTAATLWWKGFYWIFVPFEPINSSRFAFINTHFVALGDRRKRKIPFPGTFCGFLALQPPVWEIVVTSLMSQIRWNGWSGGGETTICCLRV